MNFPIQDLVGYALEPTKSRQILTPSAWADGFSASADVFVGFGSRQYWWGTGRIRKFNFWVFDYLEGKRNSKHHNCGFDALDCIITAFVADIERQFNKVELSSLSTPIEILGRNPVAMGNSNGLGSSPQRRGGCWDNAENHNRYRTLCHLLCLCG